MGIVGQLNAAMSGKKTNLTAAWTFGFALFLVMNGVGVDEAGAIHLAQDQAGLGALLTAMSAGMATTRAAIAKAAVPILGVALFVGCASLATVDPATGTSPAEDIVAAVGAITPLFGPGISAAAGGITSGILSIIIALGKAKE